MPRNFFFLLLLFLSPPFFSIITASPVVKAEIIRDASWQKTYELYREVPCLTAEELEYGAEVIAGLGYNSSRAFRKLSQTRGINFAKSKEAWSILIGLGLTYEQLLAFEEWIDLDWIHIDLALEGLQQVTTLDYEAGRSFRSYCSLPKISPLHALRTIPLLNRLGDAQNRALQSLLSLPDISTGAALDGLSAIARLDYYQARTAEALIKIPSATVPFIMDALPLLRMLNMESAWNARTLYSGNSMTRDNAWYWLVAFFATPVQVQEKEFQQFTVPQKELLLNAFYAGGEELIWKINNLHGVTDRFGMEISNWTLNKYSDRELRELFEGLSPQTRSTFGDRFYYPENKSAQISVLKQAIAAERVATARRLTSANIYALLAQGSELYDSSFRDILVPVLKNQIDSAFDGNLLAFLRAADPGNQLVSSFIVSLAQKGKLTTFFPKDSREQEEILELVSRSAFKDEDSIILFSATLMHLLEELQPGARSFLVRQMGGQADEGSASYSRLITVILQYYLEEFPELLGPEDRSIIARLLVRHGAVDLNDFLATPFAEWKKDGVLSSLSIFHPDDDGRSSFQSNGGLLLESGYELSLSDQFTTLPISAETRKFALKLIADAKSDPARSLSRLFQAMQQHRFAVSFIRVINGLTINHAIYVYSDEKHQELLLERFFRSSTEMLAQRGHSYWRPEQITDPIETLLSTNRIDEEDLYAMQRFLSLGSCGGVKAYSRLNQLFLGNVDILATIGSGLAVINNPYNKIFFEVIARNSARMTWKDIALELDFIFKGEYGRDYLQPGSLPAILHKIIDLEKKRANQAASRQNRSISRANQAG